MRITYVSPLSLAKVALVLYAVLGLVFGTLFAVLSLFGAAFGAASGEESPMIGAFFGVGAVVFLPIFYGGMGAVVAFVGAWFYNLVAGFVGGVEIRVETSTVS
jgi:uncharacterized membrane protein YjgN (DUF898 family)